MADISWFQHRYGSPDKFPTDEQFLMLSNVRIENVIGEDQVIKKYYVKNNGGTWDLVHSVTYDFTTNPTASASFFDDAISTITT